MNGEVRYERVGNAAVLTIDRPRAPQRGRRRHRPLAARAASTTSRPTRGLASSSSPAPAARRSAPAPTSRRSISTSTTPPAPRGFTRLTPSKPAIAAIDGLVPGRRPRARPLVRPADRHPELHLRLLRAPLGGAAGRRRHPAPAAHRRPRPGDGADPHRPPRRRRRGPPDRPRQPGCAPPAGTSSRRSSWPSGSPPSPRRRCSPTAAPRSRASACRSPTGSRSSTASAARRSRSPFAAPPASPPARVATARGSEPGLTQRSMALGSPRAPPALRRASRAARRLGARSRAARRRTSNSRQQLRAKPPSLARREARSGAPCGSPTAIASGAIGGGRLRACRSPSRGRGSRAARRIAAARLASAAGPAGWTSTISARPTSGSASRKSSSAPSPARSCSRQLVLARGGRAHPGFDPFQRRRRRPAGSSPPCRRSRRRRPAGRARSRSSTVRTEVPS